VISQALEKLTGQKAMIVGPGIRTGLNIKMDNPSSVGADLITGAVAAIASYPLPCIIIDMGTATTVTVVDAKGRYIGGAIMPGVRLSMHALADGTSLLPNIEITPPQKTIASNTIDCMKSGIIYGSAGALDGILDHYIDELGGSVGSVVATGGLASTICPMCRHAITLDSNLLLKGLYVIYQKNKAKKHRK
jgi:type III pantothenate kinase